MLLLFLVSSVNGKLGNEKYAVDKIFLMDET